MRNLILRALGVLAILAFLIVSCVVEKHEVRPPMPTPTPDGGWR